MDFFVASRPASKKHENALCPPAEIGGPETAIAPGLHATPVDPRPTLTWSRAHSAEERWPPVEGGWTCPPCSWVEGPEEGR